MVTGSGNIGSGINWTDWENSPLVSKITFPSGNTYYIKDDEARYVIEEIIANCPTTTDMYNAIQEAMVGGFQVVNSLPTASANTMGRIYLVPGQSGSGQNTKIEYVTIRSGSDPNYTYSWEELGTTELDLSNLGTLAYKDTVTLNKGDGDQVLGESTSFTAGSSSVTFSGGTTDKCLGSDATFTTTVTPTTSKLSTTTVPNVTAAGSASTWNFAMGTGDDSETLIISGANGSAPTLGTAITVATGSVASNGSGATVATGITSASTSANNKDEVTAITGLGTGTAAAQTITVGTNDKVKVAKYTDLSVSVS